MAQRVESVSAYLYCFQQGNVTDQSPTKERARKVNERTFLLLTRYLSPPVPYLDKNLSKWIWRKKYLFFTRKPHLLARSTLVSSKTNGKNFVVSCFIFTIFFFFAWLVAVLIISYFSNAIYFKLVSLFIKWFFSFLKRPYFIIHLQS